ncbi:hypothetical protein [Marinimicrobium locisalis]|uniref:hypothetical protein n=1 Tax=Marinimicrobium locisalis TaxID=546022 RepID=UPI003222227D
MKYKRIAFILVLTMLTSIFKAFSKQPPETGAPRTTDLSGNRLTFAMVEDFSRDMPARDLVTDFNLSQLNLKANDEAGLLIQRWWDIKEPGWFGRELGTVMLDISVREVVANTSQRLQQENFNTRDKLQFVFMYDEYLTQKYRSMNLAAGAEEHEDNAHYYSAFTLLGEKLLVKHKDYMANGQNWVESAASGPSGTVHQLFAIPLTDDHFLEVTLIFAINRGYPTGHYFLERADRITEPFLDTLFIDYARENPYQSLVGERWHTPSVKALMQEQYDTIVKQFPAQEAPEALDPADEQSE